VAARHTVQFTDTVNIMAKTVAAPRSAFTLATSSFKHSSRTICKKAAFRPPFRFRTNPNSLASTGAPQDATQYTPKDLSP
jgi:hypothetical protein